MPRKCCVVNCTNRHKVDKDKPFYRLQQVGKKQRAKWIEILKKNDPNFVRSRKEVICVDHFDKDSLYFSDENSRPQLESFAVPSVFPRPDNMYIGIKNEMIIPSHCGSPNEADNELKEHVNVESLAPLDNNCDLRLPSKRTTLRNPFNISRNAKLKRNAQNSEYLKLIIDNVLLTVQYNNLREKLIDKSIENISLKRKLKRVKQKNENSLVPCKKKKLIDAASTYLSGITLSFFKSQILMADVTLTDDLKGKRWPKDIKKLAKALYKKSPKAYKLLSNNFILPAADTLAK